MPINTIATFNGVKKFRPIKNVVEILRKSKVLQVSEDGENVKRIVPLDLSRGKKKQESKGRKKKALVVMEVPFDSERLITSQLQENIENFFHKLNDNIVQILLKRDTKKRFHGKVFH